MSEELVLVTGGSGYIGSCVVKLLLEEGCRVRTTVRDTKNEAKVKHLNDLCPGAKHKLEIVEADLLQEDSWQKAVEGCVVVHHVASPFPLTVPRHEDDIIKPAVEGTLNVLKACAAAKTVKRVVVTSSFAAVGGSPHKEGAYTEEDWLNTEDMTSAAYSRSKGLAEKAAWKFVEELPEGEKFELAVVNPTMVLGPVTNGSDSSSMSAIQKLLKRELPLVPKFSFAICDVRDVALAHYKCQTVPEAAGHRHIIVTGSWWMKQMADALSKEFGPQGYNVPTTNMPSPLLAIASLFVPEVKFARKFASYETIIDNSRFTKVLGITPTPIEKSIIDMAYTMIDKGFVPKTANYKGQSSAAGN